MSTTTRGAGRALFWRHGTSTPEQSGAGAGQGLALTLLALLGAGFLPAQIWQQPGLAGFALSCAFGVTVLTAYRRRALTGRGALAATAGLGLVMALRFLPVVSPLAEGGLQRMLLGAVLGLGALGLNERLPNLGETRMEPDRSPGFLSFTLGWQAIAVVAIAVLLLELMLFNVPVDISSALHAELIALCILTVRNFTGYALARQDRVGRGSAGTIAALGLGLFTLLPAALKLASVTPGTVPAIVALLASAMMLLLVSVLRTARAAAACAAASCAALGEMTDHVPDIGSSIPELAAIAAFIMVFVALNRFAQWGMGDGLAATGAGRRFQADEGRWLAVLDLDRRLMSFPLSREADLRDVPFSHLFAHAELPPLMELFRRLNAPASSLPDSGDPTPLTITIPGEAPTLMRARVLSREDGQIWLSLAAEQSDRSLADRLQACEASLVEARSREEHLLAVASHELRTPVAILAMLVEDMKAGSSWDEIGISMESTVRRLTGIMENLRAQTDSQGRGEIFTLAEIGFQILETFSSSAADMRLRLDQSQDSELLLQGAPVRIVVALSKLVHNAIVHSHGTEVTISSFLTPGEGNTATVTWMVRDDGTGIAEAARGRIFEAFRAAGNEGTGDATPGLGLYYARKSIGMIGGKLWLDEAVRPGACFVMTHPVRLLREEPETDEPRQEMTQDSVPYASKSALLVEDNKLVGELTANRLRRLFGTVTWVETGVEALASFRAAQPSIIFVDQLLPGMTGSELVEEIRRISPSVPVVGITASTLGSECERLEAAGANLAVEKPLSFDQTRLIAQQFFGTAD